MEDDFSIKHGNSEKKPETISSNIKVSYMHKNFHLFCHFYRFCKRNVEYNNFIRFKILIVRYIKFPFHNV